MVPDPLHPAVVHFPIVFAVLLPIVAGIALWAVRRGTGARRAWAAPVALAAALSLSAWVATETGEDQEERVETVVAEAPLESHEEAADRFLLGSLGVLAVMVIGLAKGRVGAVARGAGLVAALTLTVAGYQVGHSGGELVYRHGAASAYTASAASQPQYAPEKERHRDR